MKRIGLWGGILFVVVIGIAVYTAMQTGETSPIYASGTITLTNDLTDSAKGIRTLFLTVFDGNGGPPMPYGAVKETLDKDAQGKFFTYAITREKLMIMNPNRRQPRLLRIKARLDLDGQGGPDQPGDLIGTVDTVNFGAQNADIVINQKVQ